MARKFECMGGLKSIDLSFERSIVVPLGRSQCIQPLLEYSGYLGLVRSTIYCGRSTLQLQT